MNSPEMHLQHAGKPQIVCATCGTSGPQNRPQQRFCSTKCRNAYHQKLTPEALHRQIEDLKAQLATIKATTEDLNRRVTALDDPTAR